VWEGVEIDRAPEKLYEGAGLVIGQFECHDLPIWEALA
jgi:hypothetical protein